MYKKMRKGRGGREIEGEYQSICFGIIVVIMIIFVVIIMCIMCIMCIIDSDWVYILFLRRLLGIYVNLDC